MLNQSDVYRRSVAWLLMIVYALNFMDRQVVSVLLPQIQREFHVSDALAGLLHGTAFAIFYVTLGLPIARWADAGNRVRLISLATLVWGAMTALCGLARTFPALFLARMGVGVGEAGCSPAAYSLLAGYFPPERRPGAMAVYSAGVPLGSALGLALGGVLAQAYGWRNVFLIFGIPSVVAAFAVVAYIGEPPRSAPAAEGRPRFIDVLRTLWGLHSFRHAALATSLLAFAGFGAGAWVPSFLVRSHAMPIAHVGIALAATTLFLAFPATVIGGRIGQRLARSDTRFQMWFPALAMASAVPFSLGALLLPEGSMEISSFAVPTYLFVVLFLGIATAAVSTYFGPVLAAIQTMVADPMRATTTAVFLFTTNLIGLGAGPFLIGFISDTLKSATGAQSLRWSLLVTVAVNLWAALHFWLGGRWLKQDLGRVAEPT